MFELSATELEVNSFGFACIINVVYCRLGVKGLGKFSCKPCRIGVSPVIDLSGYRDRVRCFMLC